MMTEPAKLPTEPPEGTSQPAESATNPQVNPNLSASLRENYDAVQEDLRQANELAASLESRLAGKSKEVLHLKFLFEQTKSHLGHMQDNIVVLRKERHKLANDAMRATGLEMMLTRVTAERDRLKKELEGVLEGLAVENAQNAKNELSFDKRDHRIAELMFEVMHLRQEVEELRRKNPSPEPIGPVPQPHCLKTVAEGFMKDESDLDGVEIIATEMVPGRRR